MTNPATKVSVRDLEMVLTRTRRAPRELVWKAWTDPAHLARWFGPHAVSVPLCEADVRVGGAREARMSVITRFASNADRDANVALGATVGWGESFEKLDALVAA